MNPSPETEALVAQQLNGAIADLLWTSETDAPFTVEIWQLDEGEDNILSEQVLGHAQLPPETAVEILDLDTFFAPAIKPQPWHTPIEQAQVDQFEALYTLLVEALTKIQVYRCGVSELDIYIVGQSANRSWIVLHTQAVET